MPSVIRHIVPVSQPQGSNLCWVAVIAMITGRHGTGIINTILEEAKARHVPIDSANRLDELTGVPALARAFGLSHVRVSDVLAGSELSTRLGRAPLGLFGTLTAPPAGGGTPRHALAVHGITGDFEASSTCQVLGVDPRGFTAINRTFFDLQTQFNIEFIAWKA